MATYEADVSWFLRDGEDFANGRYSRAHELSFDGGIELTGSASPHVVGKWADPSAVDPEEMLVAALSSCHMLTFLHVARRAGFVVGAYRDHAVGTMTEVAPKRLALTAVVLHPAIEWVGEPPGEHRLSQLHAAAHDGCFIANSVRTEVTIGRPEA